MINQDATLDEIRQAGFDPLLRARALGNETVEELVSALCASSGVGAAETLFGRGSRRLQIAAIATT